MEDVVDDVIEASAVFVIVEDMVFVTVIWGLLEFSNIDSVNKLITCMNHTVNITVNVGNRIIGSVTRCRSLTFSETNFIGCTILTCML